MSARDEDVASVAVDGGGDLFLSYAIPEALKEKLAVGSRVEMPLRGRKTLGTVVAIGPSEREIPGLLPLGRLVHERPIFTPVLIKLAEWAASYYAVSLPVMFRGMLPESVRSAAPPVKTRKVIRLKKRLTDEEFAQLEKRAPQQAAIVRRLRDTASSFPLRDAASAPAAHALERKGWVAIAAEKVERDPHADEEFVASVPLDLTGEQKAALDAVVEAVDAPEDHSPVLLHGVTGSGKTEVYLQGIAHAIAKGRSALVLVPEIALTPQTVQRFKSRFAGSQDRVAVLHSHLSSGERYDEWHKVHRGGADIVIGARSALFAPLENLGVIVVDEEHEPSYKQETTPRYHGRDLAVVRAALEPCAIVLGSATPALESHHNALTGKYRKLELNERVDNRSLPLIRVIDMRLESRKHKGSLTILSDRLRMDMEQRFENKEQVLLFLNRRGFATSMQCLECGHVCQCAHCTLPLTYHLSEQRLVCHFCGYREIAPRTCPKCDSPSVRLGGYGTEKAEEVLRKVFPKIRMARVDADVMQRKGRLRETLNKFRKRELDMLVGTQMIAKGLHFPNVTLVGILNADLGLYLPDFRAGERTFQLLTQVAGRAGRGHLEGEVVVQTFTPHSPSIQFARHHDYPGYAEQELQFRKNLNYPPHSHVVLVHARSRNEDLVEFAIGNFAGRLRREMPPGIVMSDPLPAPLKKGAGLFRFQFMMRCTNARLMVRHLKNVINTMTFPDEVILIIDVDPVHML